MAAQGWNEGFSENQFMEKNVIKVSVDPNRLDTPYCGGFPSKKVKIEQKVFSWSQLEMTIKGNK